MLASSSRKETDVLWDSFTVEWDVPAAGDTSEPVMKRDTFVAGESEQLARGGGHVRHAIGCSGDGLVD